MKACVFCVGRGVEVTQLSSSCNNSSCWNGLEFSRVLLGKPPAFNMRYLSGKSYSSELCAAYLPSRGKRLLRYTTCTSLTRVTYSVTTVPLTSGRISLGNFETTQYSEDNCYFVAKISLIYSNGSTRPAIKYQALVSSSFPRLNHLY